MTRHLNYRPSASESVKARGQRSWLAGGWDLEIELFIGE